MLPMNEKMELHQSVYDLCALFLAQKPEIDSEANRVELANAVHADIEAWIKALEHKRKRYAS